MERPLASSQRPPAFAWALLALAILIDVIIRLRLLSVPLDRDEGEYGYFGQLLLQGIPPYTTAYNFKLPGIYGVYAGILATFGQTPAGIHAGLLVANLASCVLVILLATRVFTPVAGLAAGATFAVLSLSSRLYGLTAYAEHFVLPLALAGTLVLLFAVDSGRRLAFFASGVLFGLAFMVKQSAAAFVIFGALYALSQRRLASRLVPTLALIAGAVLPYAALCVVLGLVGAFGNFWFWTVRYAFRYATDLSLEDALTLLAFTGGEILTTAYLVVAVAVIGASAVIWDGVARSQRWFVGWLTLCSFVGTAAGFHFRRQYFLLLLPATALLAGLAVDAVSRALRGRAAIWRLGVPLALAILPLAQLLHAERGILLEAAPERAARAFWGQNPFPESIEIARFLTARAAPIDRIAVIGSEPQIYFYTRRPAATGFIYTYALVEDQPYAADMQRQMIAEIEAARPRFVVLVNVTESWAMRPRSDRTLFQWWARYQHGFDRVGFVEIVSDQLTRYAWGPNAATYTPQSGRWVAVFERR